MTKKIPTINIHTAERDYLTITKDDDDELVALKNKVSRLSQVDKIIFLLYVEHGSLRKIAKILDVSLTTAHKRVKAIKKKLLT